MSGTGDAASCVAASCVVASSGSTSFVLGVASCVVASCVVASWVAEERA